MITNPYEEIYKRFDGIEQLLVQLQQSQKNELQEELLLSPSEACKIFQPKISRATLYNWTNQGLIQKHSVGGRVFYKKSEILSSLTSLKKYSRV